MQAGASQKNKQSNRLRWWVGGIAGAALLSTTPLSQAETLEPEVSAAVVNLRLGRVPGRTRVVFDLSDKPGPFSLTTLSDPDRVVVELPTYYSNFDSGDLLLRGTPIQSVVAAREKEEPLRFVFDLKRKAEPRLYALKPYLHHGHRLVLDLYNAADSDSDPAPGNSGSTEPPIQLAARESSRQPNATTPRSATRIENPVSSGLAGEWSGYASLESRLFFSDPAFAEQDGQNISVAFQPEYYLDWADGNQRFAFSPFMRYDANDSERTHFDIRELFWQLEYEDFVVKAGVDVVFWGVTESQHLVDVINQTDLVENIDGEDKLGQPMLNLDYNTADWGTLHAYLLPYFRERTFPGKDGRLRTQPYIDGDDARYEAGSEEKHVDLAVRWSHFIGDWDIGLAHFSGTSREPVYVAAGTALDPHLAPVYLQIDQTSLDVQATMGAWLWKLESIYNSNSIDDYFAAAGGFEYTVFGVANTTADLGWLLEYHYDERDEFALSGLQNDVFAGIRYSGNDISGTRLLAGIMLDTDNGSSFGNVEAIRRLGESWTIALEARVFFNIDSEDLWQPLEEDDYIELQLSRFF